MQLRTAKYIMIRLEERWDRYRSKICSKSTLLKLAVQRLLTSPRKTTSKMRIVVCNYIISDCHLYYMILKSAKEIIFVSIWRNVAKAVPLDGHGGSRSHVLNCLIAVETDILRFVFIGCFLGVTILCTIMTFRHELSQSLCPCTLFVHS